MSELKHCTECGFAVLAGSCLCTEDCEYNEISLDITKLSAEELEQDRLKTAREMGRFAEQKKIKVLKYMENISGTKLLTWEHLAKKFDLDVRMEKCHEHNGIGLFGFYTDISRYAVQVFDLHLACKPLYKDLPLSLSNFEII